MHGFYEDFWSPLKWPFSPSSKNPPFPERYKFWSPLSMNNLLWVKKFVTLIQPSSMNGTILETYNMWNYLQHGWRNVWIFKAWSGPKVIKSTLKHLPMATNRDRLHTYSILYTKTTRSPPSSSNSPLKEIIPLKFKYYFSVPLNFGSKNLFSPLKLRGHRNHASEPILETR